MSGRRGRFALLVVLVLTLAGGYQALADDAPSAVPASIATLKPEVLANAQQTWSYLFYHNSTTDPQYFASGTWHYTNDAACPPCRMGPASLSAALYAATKDPYYLSIANATIDRAVINYAHADGSVGDATTPEPIFFLHEIGFTCATLRPGLDATHAAQCSSVMSKGADWLVASGNSTWYANGNIVAMQVAVFYYAWLASGNAKYLDLYESELKFLVDPPQTGNNVGFGLKFSVYPTLADGSDGSAYLAERGATTGFDGDYTHLQLSMLGRLYVVNRDARILRLCNLLFNQVWGITNHSTFVTDATGGSRHDAIFPLWTGSVGALAWLSGRPDALPILSDQLHLATFPTFLGNARDNWGNPGLYRDVGIDQAMLVLASMDERLR